jgi:uncharacterized protein YkwD
MSETVESQQLFVNPTSADQSSALNIHNTARHSKNLKPLKWDQGLSNAATQWAQHLAKEGKFYHSQGSGQGENLFWISSSSNPYHGAAQAWIDERKNYHGEKIPEGNFASYGHYSEFLHEHGRNREHG